jgi:hypothetical protein
MPGAGGIGLSGAHDTPGPELATLLRPDGEARPAYLGLTGEQPYKQVRPPPMRARYGRARYLLPIYIYARLHLLMPPPINTRPSWPARSAVRWRGASITITPWREHRLDLVPTSCGVPALAGCAGPLMMWLSWAAGRRGVQARLPRRPLSAEVSQNGWLFESLWSQLTSDCRRF